MKVLVACEYSGVVREAFRKLGYDAYSCDLIPTDIPSPFHIQDDVLRHLNEGWDLMIAHPPCTYLCVTGARWLHDTRQKFANRKQQQEEAIAFVKALWNAPIKRICIENPVGVLSSQWKLPDQIVQPYYFGETASKATCFWLKNLPGLKPTKLVKPEMVELNNGKRFSLWYYKTSKKCSERAKIRSKTFQGIADAMAAQWGNYKPLQFELSYWT